MRLRLGLLTSVCALICAAADGTWTRNAEKSTMKGCPSSLLKKETLIIPADIGAASTTPRTPKSEKAEPFRVRASTDGRTLIATPVAASDCKIVFEKR